MSEPQAADEYPKLDPRVHFAFLDQLHDRLDSRYFVIAIGDAPGRASAAVGRMPGAADAPIRTAMGGR